MLAEIYLLRLEAEARTATTGSRKPAKDPRFVPVEPRR
jgi:hypothetical protein